MSEITYSPEENNAIDIFKKEEFPIVYTWKDEPGVEYAKHTHTGKVSLFITQGSLELTFAGYTVNLEEGDRLNIPIGVMHSGIVGKHGCEYVVGQEIEGDA